MTDDKKSQKETNQTKDDKHTGATGVSYGRQDADEIAPTEGRKDD